MCRTLKEGRAMERVIRTEWDEVAAQVVGVIAVMPGVVAVSLGGSVAVGLADDASDLDLHVYWAEHLPPADVRAARLRAIADPDSIRTGLTSWGMEDQFSVGDRPVELIYRRWADVADEVERAYDAGLPGQGFTTAVLYSVARGEPLHDPTGALNAAGERLVREFPEATRTAVLRREIPLLGFHLGHLRRAQDRGDIVFAQHLRYKVQMLFFDVLFALNRLYHPGEKRLLEHSRRCLVRPIACENRWERAVRLPSDDPALAQHLGDLIAELCDLVRLHGGVEIPSEPL
ncbi:MAG: DUF4037 domain-containing protein [Chloroflexia bacterium]|nr:DUF4037 domain-containing protein [Chloroflexia bacterium]